MWHQKIIKNLDGVQVINDSKTPSGRVHIGSLRGVLIHDAIYRRLVSSGHQAKYIYGIDDYDPLDGLPADASEEMQSYMGLPLCRVPAPAGSTATNLADHYISEFLTIFEELGVGAEIYHTRDIYRSGRFNEVIDTILKKADRVKQVYADVSKVTRAKNWHPFQVICEQCGKIGTTEVTQYNGQEVTYECKTDLVNWATGCGYQGAISPFDGHGKLPWKLEWVAKWHTLGITIEGAGKDHCTKGGARDVAVACLKAIFGQQAPLNIPYEFFLVSGAKMSSSKGVGTSAREMANLLPPEVLRFLMIRTPPKKTVNFSSDFEYIVKLHNEYDQLIEACLTQKANPSQQDLLHLTTVNQQTASHVPISFQLLTALTQMPHINIENEVAQRVKEKLTDADKKNLRDRLQSVRYWLDHFATAEDRVELQTELPPSVADLSDSQRAFLNILAGLLPKNRLHQTEYQRLIFDAARLTPLNQKLAFQAIYRALLNKDQGPKGGALFSYLDPNFLMRRFSEPTYCMRDYWEETSISEKQCEDWLDKYRETIVDISFNSPEQGMAEFCISLDDGKKHMQRVHMVGNPENLVRKFKPTANSKT